MLHSGLLCGEARVLIDEAAESPLAYHRSSRSLCPRRDRNTKSESPVGTGVVVMTDVLRDMARRLLSPKISIRSRASRRALCTHLSAKAFAWGAWAGVFTTLTPSERKTSSKAVGNLQSRSRIRMVGCSSPLPMRQDRLRACCVTHARSGWSVPGEEDLASGQFDS